MQHSDAHEQQHDSKPVDDACVVAIVIPAYNEEQTVVETMTAFHTVLPDAEIWVINNASTDATAQVARSALSNFRCKGGLLDEPRRGKGNAVRRAFMDIDADVYVLVDADMTYPASQAPSLIAPITAGDADMVVGDRLSGGHYARENKRPFHTFGNRLVRGLVNRLFKSQLTDIMSGYRACSHRFVKSYPVLVEGFELETDMTLHALDKRLRIVEIPVEYASRPPCCASKLSTFRDGARVLVTIWNILRHHRPFFFFGGAALLCAILGMLAGAPFSMNGSSRGTFGMCRSPS